MKPLNVELLARPALFKLSPYSSARDEFSGTAEMYLDANESPFPTEYNRYPDPHQRQLKEALSGIKKIQVSQIFLGNGSDEPIDLLIRAFCQPDRDKIIVCEPTYGMYRAFAGVNSVEVINAPLTPDFQLNAPAVQKVFSPQTKLLFLCSPNNPTGNLLDSGRVAELLDSFHGLVVIDEAYIDFATSGSWLSRLNEFQNLIVLQTLSKAWGLAGIRLGMALAHPDIVALLNRIKPPYNISGLSQQVALNALEGYDFGGAVNDIRSQREWLSKQLSSLPSVRRVHPSDANFLLVQFADSSRIFARLRSASIIVRDRSRALNCDNCLRITVGTQRENEELMNTLQRL